MLKIKENREKVIIVTLSGCAFLLVVALILFYLSPSFEEIIVDDRSPDSIKILFIGNSLTYTHNVPAQFVDLTKSEKADCPLFVKQLVYPNYTLEDHWRRKVAQKEISSQRWDYVILQGHSSEPVKDPRKLIHYITLFDDLISAQ